MPTGHPLLLPRENGRPLDRHTVTRIINKAGSAAGLPHIHPHQLRHTLATQAINRGMSLEAIAAMLGHNIPGHDTGLRQDRQPDRRRGVLHRRREGRRPLRQPRPLPADALGPNMARLNREHHRLLGNGYCVRPTNLDCEFENICETCTFFTTGLEFRPTLLAQRDDACAKGQTSEPSSSTSSSPASRKATRHEPRPDPVR